MKRPGVLEPPPAGSSGRNSTSRMPANVSRPGAKAREARHRAPRQVFDLRRRVSPRYRPGYRLSRFAISPYQSLAVSSIPIGD